MDGEETVSLVRDNGIGIGANELFYHVDNSINKGTGAGPAIVKRIVVAPGSHIGVEQKHEKAARFVLRCRFTLRAIEYSVHFLHCDRKLYIATATCEVMAAT